MGRLIDVDKLCTDLMERWDIADKRKEELVRQVMADIVTPIVVSQPTIEPERKKGKWQITDAYPHNVYCSECHTRFAQTHWAVWEDGSLPRNFCPNCGADMRGDENDQSKQ